MVVGDEDGNDTCGVGQVLGGEDSREGADDSLRDERQALAVLLRLTIYMYIYYIYIHISYRGFDNFKFFLPHHSLENFC